MTQKTDIDIFLKKESDSTEEHIKEFLKTHRIFDLNKKDQITKTAKLIAKFPWGGARTIEELLVTKKFGTCTARHSALESCYKLLGIPCHQVISTFRWGEQGIQFPEELQRILDEGEWDHGHNFLQIEDDDKKIDVDITWNSKLKEYGFMTFPEDWDGKTSFVGLNINKRWDDVEDMKAKKIELIESLSPELRDRREYFLKLFVRWIHTINQLD